MLRQLTTVFLTLVVLFPYSSAAEEPVLKVGVVIPLSGGVAAMGEGFRKGIVMFEKETPRRHVKFIFEDHRYDGKSAISAMKKLRSVDGVDAVIVWGNTPSDSCAPVAEQERVPLIAISMNPVARNRQYVVALGPPLERLVDRVIAEFQRQQFSTPAAVSIDIGNALAGIERINSKLGGTLLTKVITNEESDFKTLILGLRKNKVDGLFLLTLPEQALTFLRQSKQLGFQPKIIGGDVFADEAFQAEGTRYVRDLGFVYGAVKPEFRAKIRQEYSNSSYFFETASGYAVAQLLDQAAQRLRQGEGKEVLKALESVDPSVTPLVGLQLVVTAEKGRHFESDGEIYRAQG